MPSANSISATGIGANGIPRRVAPGDAARPAASLPHCHGRPVRLPCAREELRYRVCDRQTFARVVELPRTGQMLASYHHADRGLRLEARVGYLEQRSTSDV